MSGEDVGLWMICILQGVGDKRRLLPARLRSWLVFCIREGVWNYIVQKIMTTKSLKRKNQAYGEELRGSLYHTRGYSDTLSIVYVCREEYGEVEMYTEVLILIQSCCS